MTKINAEGSALVYSTYLGGNGDDVGRGVAVDSSGNAYVTGSTSSTNFPTEKAFQAAYGGRSSSSSAGSNAFVTKLNAAGSAPVYSTYLGGSGFDGGSGIAVDSSGNAFVTGGTSSTNVPTANALQAAHGGPSSGGDAFVTKLNAAGSALVFSTHLGGNGNDGGGGVAVDSSGNVYVTGTTSSTNFPTERAFQAAYGGRSSLSSDGSNAFVTKLNAAGSALVYSTYVGGRRFDRGNGIAVDSSGNTYVTGYATSPDFPTTNALLGTFRGGDSDGFILKITDEPAAPPPPQPPPQPPPPAPVPSVTTVSAASFAQGAALAPGAIGSAFGSGLAAGTQVASTVPLPISLGGTSVRVRDSSGAELPAPLFFVSAGQINYLVPEDARTGTATVTVLNDGRTVAQGTIQIDTFAPALFTANANGSGVPAALAIRAAADAAQTTPPVFDCSAGPGRCVPAALDLGAPSDQVVLLLFGSGIRGTAGLPTARVTVAGADMEVLYAGPQGSFVGLDQVNVRLSRSLVGRGEVDVVVTVGGKAANTVRLRVQ